MLFRIIRIHRDHGNHQQYPMPIISTSGTLTWPARPKDLVWTAAHAKVWSPGNAWWQPGNPGTSAVFPDKATYILRIGRTYAICEVNLRLWTNSNIYPSVAGMGIYKYTVYIHADLHHSTSTIIY